MADITKELRDAAHRVDRGGVVTAWELRRIADRIGKAHEDDYARAYCLGIDLGRDNVADMEPQDPWLAEHGLCKLPGDADGEAIRVGDKVSMPDPAGPGSVLGTVTGIEYRENHVSLSVAPWGRGCSPETLRHHKPTPAERIGEIVNRMVGASEGYYTEDDETVRDLRRIAAELEGEDEMSTPHERSEALGACVGTARERGACPGCPTH